MLCEGSHLSENDLVLAADGELPSRRKAEVNAHLEACWTCRERMLSLQETITGFVRARNRELNPQLPPEAGPRALLRARMSESSQASRPVAAATLLPRAGMFWRLAPAVAAFGAALLGILIVFQATVNAEGPKPRSALTPGETRPITIAEVCGYSEAEVIARNIPEDTQRRVFAAYGIRPARREQFEVDYLITPDLGGTQSIKNLWPQPYSALWNAHVKDKLEQRLHKLVCGGRLDLATAQHDIAADWIGAYRKYVGQGGAR